MTRCRRAAHFFSPASRGGETDGRPREIAEQYTVLANTQTAQNTQIHSVFNTQCKLYLRGVGVECVAGGTVRGLSWVCVVARACVLSWVEILYKWGGASLPGGLHVFINTPSVTYIINRTSGLLKSAHLIALSRNWVYSGTI